MKEEGKLLAVSVLGAVSFNPFEAAANSITEDELGKAVILLLSARSLAPTQFPIVNELLGQLLLQNVFTTVLYPNPHAEVQVPKL